MADINKRTKLELQEAYEDFLFKNVMAIYAANESAEIEKEAAELGEAKPEEAKKLFNKKERKENIKNLLTLGKKAFLAVASVALVAVVSLYGAMVVSAEVREAVADTIYSFAYGTGVFDGSTYIRIENPSISDEDWTPMYSLEYIPDNFTEEENESYRHGFTYGAYKSEEKYYTDGVNNLLFVQYSPSTEIEKSGEFDDKKKVQIKNSEGFLLRKNNIIEIIWSTSDTLFGLSGDLDEETMLKIARSIIGGAFDETPEEEYVYNDSNAYPTESFKIFQGETGKFGLADKNGSEIISAIYDEIIDEKYYFILYKEEGTYQISMQVGYRYEMVEVPKPSNTIYFPNGVQVGPFETYDISGMTDEFLIMGIADGSRYEYDYVKGKLNLKSCDEKNDCEYEAFGYKVTSVWQGGFIRPKKGITDAEGNEVLPAISRSIRIPFEDRAVCREGGQSENQGMECGQTFIYDLETGEELCGKYNEVNYSVFEEGYIGVARSCGYFGEHAIGEAEEAGFEVAPAGVWFVDKDGNPVSERYERIYTLSYGDFYYTEGQNNITLPVYGEKADGTSDRFILKDILIPYE